MTPHTHTAAIRRALQTSAQPLTRAALYERQRGIDDIIEMDRCVALMVAAGQVRRHGDRYQLPT